MTWKAVGSKGFVVDVDTSEKQHGCVSVNKKRFHEVTVYLSGENVTNICELGYDLCVRFTVIKWWTQDVLVGLRAVCCISLPQDHSTVHPGTTL